MRSLIRKALKNKSLTELASDINVVESSIIKLLNGKTVSKVTLEKFAEYFNVPMKNISVLSEVDKQNSKKLLSYMIDKNLTPKDLKLSWHLQKFAGYIFRIGLSNNLITEINDLYNLGLKYKTTQAEDNKFIEYTVKSVRQRTQVDALCKDVKLQKFSSKIGNILRAQRLNKSLSCKEICSEFDLNTNGYWKLETGARDYMTLKGWKRLLTVSEIKACFESIPKEKINSRFQHKGFSNSSVKPKTYFSKKLESFRIMHDIPRYKFEALIQMSDTHLRKLYSGATENISFQTMCNLYKYGADVASWLGVL